MGDPQAAEAMVSADRKATLIPVTMVGTSEQVDKNIAQYLDAVQKLDSPQFQVVSVGSSSIGNEFSSTAAKDLRTTEVVGLPLTMLVLVLVFGAVAAAGVSLLLAVAAIVVALGMTALVGHFFPLSFFIVNIVTMLGLAVGIDYALFIIARYREERRRGCGEARRHRRGRGHRQQGGPVLRDHRDAGPGGPVPGPHHHVPQPGRRRRARGLGRGGRHAHPGAGRAQPAGRPHRLAASALPPQGTREAGGHLGGSLR